MALKIKDKVLIYLNALFGVAVLNVVFDIIQYHTLLNLVSLIIYIALFILIFWKTKKTIKCGAYEFLKKGHKDNIKKRINNLIYLTVYLLAIFFLNIYIAVISSQRKVDEIFTAVRPSYSWMLLGCFLLYASVFTLSAICSKEEIQKYKKFYLQQSLISLAFWMLYLCVCLFSGMRFIYSSFFIASCLYLITIIICNFTVRKHITEVNFIWKKRYTITILSVVGVYCVVSYLRRDTYYLQGYINQLPRLEQNTVPIEYREEDGVYELHMENDEFKILQLTDIHLGGSIYSIRKDKKALEAVYQEIEYTKPDFVIITGDMTFPLGIMSLSLNNGSAVSQFAAFMRNLNIPWAFTFGNHDTENMATYTEESLCNLYESLSFKTSGTLLYPYKQPDITGRNNQVIELYNKDGSLNQALFLIDSNAYTGDAINDYDYIHDDQVEWYANEIEKLNEKSGKMVPSMAFFHIPLQQYREAYHLYENGSDKVKYYFGSNDEEMKDKVCCSDYPSKIFDKMIELGSTKALFCGHDHYNNMSLEYQGIRLTYGMSIDYLAMPGIAKSEKQRGGTLITIHSDSSFDIEQIPLSFIAES